MNLLANAEDAGSIPGLGRSPGVGNGTSFWYSCLENSIVRGVRWARVWGHKESDKTERLSVGPSCALQVVCCAAGLCPVDVSNTLEL